MFWKMNLAIEYLKRDGRAKELLPIPCSIFVQNKRNIKKAISIHKCFSSKKYVLVKHWKLSEDVCSSNFLPKFEEHKLLKSEIFYSDIVILKDYFVLPYEPELFAAGDRQYPEGSRALSQEAEYTSFIDNFWNTKSNRRNREKWLWNAFESYYRLDANMTYYTERMFKCKTSYNSLWKKWLSWRKYMLDFECKIASELIFEDYFPSIDDDIILYEKEIKPINYLYHPYPVSPPTLQLYMASSYWEST